MLFPPYIVTRQGPRRFTALQLNTLGRFDEPLPLVLERQQTLLNYILQVQPSIATLQEVPVSSSALEGNANIPDSLMTQCPYYGLISYAKQSARADLGCILYDKRFFELVSEECFRFSGNASQLAIIAVLQLKVESSPNTNETAYRLLLVAQHAKAGRSSECEAVRIQQSQELLTYLTDPTASQSLYSALIRDGKFMWMGDMNAGPHDYGRGWPSEWYQRVVRGNTAIEGSEWVNTTVPLLSVMTIAHNGNEPPFTTFKMKEGLGLVQQTIDYIFISKGSTSLAVTGVTSPASIFDEGNGVPLPADGFPNNLWGSDHLPLLCEIEYRENIKIAKCERD